MSKPDSDWTFFSNHAHVYFLIARKADMIVREIADRVGITERTVHGILSDLEEGGYIERQKVGRTNTYRVIQGKHLRHSLEAEVKLDSILELIRESKAGSS